MTRHNFLYLIWKNPLNRENYIVGKLTKDNGYSFEYFDQYEKAKSHGWDMLKAFPEVKTYTSDVLFPTFSSRLPDRKRRNIKDVLKKYGLSEYDGYELLKNSGGRLPIDTYEFIDPMFEDDKRIEKEFYIQGVRHICGCEGKDCSKKPIIDLDSQLLLQRDPENEHDPFAVRIMTEQKEMLGYVPRYYSEGVSARLDRHLSYECKVIELDDGSNCQNCVKVRLIIPKNE